MTDTPPTVTVYCEGGTKKHRDPHARYLVGVFEQEQVRSERIRQAQIAAGLNPQPHYWKSLERWRDPQTRRSVRLRLKSGVQWLIGRGETPYRLPPDKTFSGRVDPAEFWLRWRLQCKGCHFDEIRGFGEVNAALDRLAESRKTVSLKDLLDEL